MNIEEKIEYLLEQVDKLGIEVRAEHIGGEGGGLCRLKGKSIIFIDLDAEPAKRYEMLLTSLSEFDTDNVYLLPEIREDIAKIQQ